LSTLTWRYLWFQPKPSGLPTLLPDTGVGGPVVVQSPDGRCLFRNWTRLRGRFPAARCKCRRTHVQARLQSARPHIGFLFWLSRSMIPSSRLFRVSSFLAAR
jgi:hypothetical protein